MLELILSIFITVGSIINLIVYFKPGGTFHHKRQIKKLLKDPNLSEEQKLAIRMHEFVENCPFCIK